MQDKWKKQIASKIEKGDFDGALEDLEAAYVEQNGIDIDGTILESAIYHATGDVEKLWSSAREGLAMDSNNSELWWLLGSACEMYGNPLHAGMCTQRAISGCDEADDRDFYMSERVRIQQQYGLMLPELDHFVLPLPEVDYEMWSEQVSIFLYRRFGFSIEHHLYANVELMGLIRGKSNKRLNVLEIGCGAGVNLTWLQCLFSNATLHGIERNATLADVSGAVADVACGDVEDMELPYEAESFDVIIMDNLLPYLKSPGEVLLRVAPLLKKDGQLLVSVPNTKYWETLMPLLCFDQVRSDTEEPMMQQFTRSEVLRLMKICGFEVDKCVDVTGNDPSDAVQKMIAELEQYNRSGQENTYTTKQFILSLKQMN
ncbi:MAG: class I SAM-dependent methyltransferase [Lachnospiraceae bacterium]|nr:class I SAM-dependent methyltransferase [Lachnospiraceae bacterium]